MYTVSQLYFSVFLEHVCVLVPCKFEPENTKDSSMIKGA